MAINEAYTGSETVGTTEHSLPNDSTTLTPITADGVYQVFVDVSAIAAGDQYEFKLYEKVTSGGTQRLVETWILTGAQSKPAWVSPSLILLHGWDFTAKKLAGTDRSLSWSIRQVA